MGKLARMGMMLLIAISSIELLDRGTRQLDRT